MLSLEEAPLKCVKYRFWGFYDLLLTFTGGNYASAETVTYFA